MKQIINHFTDNDLYTFTCMYYVLQKYPRAETEYSFFDRNRTCYPKGFDALLREQLEEVLDTLAPREKKVLELRFGIVDGRTRTLEEVGKEFNVTRERIRQIEAKALRKLRHPSRSKRLRDFLN